MFAKIFESIYDGTLADNWQALVTFQQLLILADQQGVVDKTPAAIQRRTGIPIEVILAGIAVLEQPDPQSRSKDMDGRRIVRLDPDRDWGWFLVNHATYRLRITAEEKRETDRLRIAEKRAQQRGDTSPSVAECREVSPPVADVAHTEADTEAEKLINPSGESQANNSREEPPSASPHARAVAEQPEPEREPTPAGAICRALMAAGVTRVNPSHPDLLRLIDGGVPLQEFVDTAKELGKGNLKYLCVAIEGRRKEAAEAGAVTAAARKPIPASHVPYVPEKRARGDPAAGAPAAFTEIAKSLGIAP